MSLKDLNMSFIAGCMIDDHMFYISSAFDSLDSEIQCCRMSIYDHLDGQWYYHNNTEFKAISVALVPKTENSRRVMLSAGVDGAIEFYSSQEIYYEKIDDVGFSNPNFHYGTLNKIRNIQSNLYACGNGGQIYKRIGNKWVYFDQGLLLTKVEYTTINPANILDLEYKEVFCAIYDINGHDPDCLYACGEDNNGGFIACNKNGKWLINSKRTPSSLHHIQLCPDGINVIAVGDYSTVFYGNDESGFINLKDISINDSFYQSCYFKGDLYLAASTAIYKYLDGKFEILDIIAYGTEVSTVECNSNILWALTDKELYRFDGNEWNIVLDPDNLSNEELIISIKAGEKCTKTGYWFTVARENSRQYFKQGEVLPNFKSDWGEVYWQFDGE